MGFGWQALKDELDDLAGNGEGLTRFIDGRVWFGSWIAKLHCELGQPCGGRLELSERRVFVPTQPKQIVDVV
jgi:hypothetical protein